MSSWKFSTNSYRKMDGVHSELICIASRALDISTVDFGVTEGLRSLARQQELVASGASQTMNSRHITGHAIDLVAYIGSEVRWDWPLYDELARAMKEAAYDLGIPLEWGGDWTSIKDGPHFQLPWEDYPA